MCGQQPARGELLHSSAVLPLASPPECHPQDRSAPASRHDPQESPTHARAAATLSELSEGGFQAILDDTRDASRKKNVTRLVLCSGKVYYDMVYGAAPQYTERPDYLAAEGVAVARVEQLYPFPSGDLEALVASYPSVQEVAWLQEEPQNMGAWVFMAPRLEKLIARSTL